MLRSINLKNKYAYIASSVVAISVLMVLSFLFGYKTSLENEIKISINTEYNDAMYHLKLKKLLDKNDYKKIDDLTIASMKSSYEHLKLLRELEKDVTLLHFVANPFQDFKFGEYSAFEVTNSEVEELEVGIQKYTNAQ